MNCPSCNTLLTTIDYEGVEIETCLGCGGNWLDKDELGKIVRIREVVFSPEERRAVAESTTIHGVKLEDVDRDLTCPKCGKTTDPINYGDDTGLILDRCTGCGGYWLDKGELEKVQMIVEGYEDELPDDLAKYGGRLRQFDAVGGNVDVSRMPHLRVFNGFFNALVNGILNL